MNGDTRALCMKPRRNGCANTSRGAGNQCNMTCKTHILTRYGDFALPFDQHRGLGYKGTILKDIDRYMQHDYAPALPELDPVSRAQSERCSAYIRDRIADAGGSISFAEFMHYALYAPNLGYYVAGAIKFGEAGDFVTAPEVSPVFGRVIARQAAHTLGQINGAKILEFGAGSGRLAVDLMAELIGLDALPQCYSIVEVSPDLRERQQALIAKELPAHASRFEWLDRMPGAHSGVIIANEVLDALPVERFVRRKSGVCQLRVTDEAGEFVFVEEPAPQILAAAVRDIEKEVGAEFPPNYVSEVSLSAPAWVSDMADTLEHGLALLFDYGVSRREYYAPDRDEGWLRCHFRHRAHSDALILAGVQDLTAWVDFSAVAAAASNRGLVVEGYVSQAQFLLGGGLHDEMQQFANLSPGSQLELSNQIKMLTLPGEMGENVKCMGLSRGDVPRIDTFSKADRTHTL